MVTSKFALYFFTEAEGEFLNKLEGCMSFELNSESTESRFYGVYDRKKGTTKFYSNLKKALIDLNLEKKYSKVYFQIQGNKKTEGKGFWSENGITIIKHHLE